MLLKTLLEKKNILVTSIFFPFSTMLFTLSNTNSTNSANKTLFIKAPFKKTVVFDCSKIMKVQLVYRWVWKYMSVHWNKPNFSNFIISGR